MVSVERKPKGTARTMSRLNRPNNTRNASGRRAEINRLARAIAKHEQAAQAAEAQGADSHAALIREEIAIKRADIEQIKSGERSNAEEFATHGNAVWGRHNW